MFLEELLKLGLNGDGESICGRLLTEDFFWSFSSIATSKEE